MGRKSPVMDCPRTGASSPGQNSTYTRVLNSGATSATAVVAQFSELRSRGPWDPPSEQGTIVFPGFESSEWGGTAYDLQTGLLYVNANGMPWIVKLKKRASIGKSGSALYRDNCAGCHGENRAGHPPEFPTLVGIGDRLTDGIFSPKSPRGAAECQHLRLWTTSRWAA